MYSLLSIGICLITDKQKNFLQLKNEGKIKKKRNPRRWSSYKRRTRATVEHNIKNLLWLAENAPDVLSDREYERGNNEVREHRRARALLKAVSLIENAPTVFWLIAELYEKYQFELQKKI